MTRKAAKNILRFLFIYVKWIFHRDKLKIPYESRPIYRRIFFHTNRALKKNPSFFGSESFDLNNKLKWLMVFRQDVNHPRLVDKLVAKSIVRNIVGDSYNASVYDVGNAYDDINFGQLPERFVLKCNHDSGSVWLLNKTEINHEALRAEVNSSLNRPYGWSSGQWYYSYVEPKVFAEEYLEYNGGVPPDYKFHCGGGEVICCQYISDREGDAPKEIILGPDGSVWSWQLGENFMRNSYLKTPFHWEDMCQLARNLSEGHIYIRIDLYLTDDGPRFGEFSLHPRSGNYRGVGQEILGSMIFIDKKATLPPITTK